MTEEEFEVVKRKLDEELLSHPVEVGITFGYDLYEAFEQKKLFKPRVFEAIGLPLITATYPTYASRAVYIVSEMHPDSYRIGKHGD
ncbi:hypothetical protein [Methylocella silvestris]|uniref:Uncharacterized protein n=1 Tax=Methylocella silvestris TaxID=199596 RepID=A0A2J7TLK7_METSI|nr:hypothetical protein [Methylocella silvestris]PNG27650.1 hypothetical protein CR492_01680 [Methylocella silvestris]